MLKPCGLSRLAAVLAGSVLLLANASSVMAAEIQRGETVVIGPDQVVDDDVYAFGSDVQILGRVNGDVFAAGNSVTVSGVVSGSVFAAGNTVAIGADVHRGVHAAGNTVTISGPVAQDATLASGTLTIAPGSTIGRDLLLATGTGNLAAPVGRNVLATAGNLTLAAPVGGDVQAQIDTLRLANGARVQGSLTYQSERDAQIAPEVSVGAGVQHLVPQAQTQPAPGVVAPAWAVVDWLKGLVGLAMVGLLLILLFPRFSARTVELAKSHAWASLGIGFALLVGVPVAALVVLVVGVIIGGWMLAFALLAMYAMACAVGSAFAAALVGNLLLQPLRQPPQHLAWNLVEGLLLLGLIGLLPFVGGLVLLLACAFGLGAVTLSVVRAYRGTRAPAELTPIVAPAQPRQFAA